MTEKTEESLNDIMNIKNRIKLVAGKNTKMDIELAISVGEFEKLDN